MVEPQEGGTYDEIMTLAQKAEALGFGGFFRSDHYMPVNANIPPEAVSTECWATLAGRGLIGPRGYPRVGGAVSLPRSRK